MRATVGLPKIKFDTYACIYIVFFCFRPHCKVDRKLRRSLGPESVKTADPMQPL